jgi:uncharacterized protein (TIGR00251 family)
VPVRRDGADLLVSIRLTPKSARERIGGTFTDSAGQHWLQASVSAPPEKGKANAALIALLTARLGFPRASILLETGDTNRLKRLRISGGGDAAEALLKTIAKQERNER